VAAIEHGKPIGTETGRSPLGTGSIETRSVLALAALLCLRSLFIGAAIAVRTGLIIAGHGSLLGVRIFMTLLASFDVLFV